MTAPRGPVTARAAPPRPSSTASSPCADNVGRVAASPAPVSRLLRRAGLNRLPDLEPAPAVRRYEHPAPGELLHLDIKKLGRFRRTGRRLGIRHRFTPPYTPRTNGKAERFIQTALREWAYARSYLSSPQRAAHLRPWLHDYNWHRPTPASAKFPLSEGRAGLGRRLLPNPKPFVLHSGRG